MSLRQHFTKSHTTPDVLKQTFDHFPDWICAKIYKGEVHLDFVDKSGELKIAVFNTGSKMLSSAEAVELVKSFGFELPEIKRRAPAPPMIR
jgi:hypothetical protein